MSKEEILKIQKCVLKVNIHCDGCKQKVKKILQKIDGVFTTDIDADQGKVTVTGNVESALLIKKLAKSGKHAEVWGAPKPNNNQNHMTNQFKNMQIDSGKGGGGGGNNNKGQKGGNNQPKGGQQGQHQLQLQHQQQQQQFQQQLQQLQQLQQMKGLQDLKLPQFKDLKMPGQNPNQKAVKFNLPEDDDLTDDEYDDDDFDDGFDDEFEEPEAPLNKMKPAMPNNGSRPDMMINGMMNGHHPQLMAAAQKGGNAAGNGKKGGGSGPVAVPVQVNSMGGPNSGKNGSKQGGGGGGNNQNQGGGKHSVGKNGGGFPPQSKNGNNNNGNGGKKHNGMDEGPHPMSNGFQNMNGHPGMAAAPAKMGGLGNMNNMPIAQMNNMSMGQMGSIPAVQGLPAGASGGYYQGGHGPDMMAGNPYHQQQQYLAAMMNQQRAIGNDRYQPMMYARPPPAVNYMPPYPYATHPPADPYTHYFSDENTSSSCSVM